MFILIHYNRQVCKMCRFMIIWSQICISFVTFWSGLCPVSGTREGGRGWLLGALPRFISPHEAIVPAWVARADCVILKEKLS